MGDMEPLDYSRFADTVHWRGVMAVINTADAAGRKIIQKGTMPLARELPLSIRYKKADWPAHNGAVNVGSIDKVWLEGNKLWGQGRFDFVDRYALEIIRKIRNGFVRHMSADIEPVTYKLMATTILDVPAFEEAQFTAINIPDGVLQGADSVEFLPEELESLPFAEEDLVAFAFRVVGDLGLPLADREREWDASAATGRVAEWAKSGEGIDPAEYRRAFFYQDEDSDPALKGSYKLPYADVIDGTLTAVPRAVFAAAGGHGVDAADIPDSDKATIKGRISSLYRKMAKQFDDPSLVAPWDKDDDAESKPKQDDADKPRQSYASAEEQPELVRQLVVQNRIAYAQAVGSV